MKRLFETSTQTKPPSICETFNSDAMRCAVRLEQKRLENVQRNSCASLSSISDQSMELLRQGLVDGLKS